MSLTRSLPALGVVAVVAAASTLLIANQNDSPRGEPPAASAPPAPGPSGEAAPTGDLPGWRQIFLDDFTDNVPSWGECDYQVRTCPELPEPYRSRWWAYPTQYPDTRENQDGNGGFYKPSNLSMADGMLRLQLRRENGTTQAAAPIPKIGARTYGRYAMRYPARSRPPS